MQDAVYVSSLTREQPGRRVRNTYGVRNLGIPIGPRLEYDCRWQVLSSRVDTVGLR